MISGKMSKWQPWLTIKQHTEKQCVIENQQKAADGGEKGVKKNSCNDVVGRRRGYTKWEKNSQQQ